MERASDLYVSPVVSLPCTVSFYSNQPPPPSHPPLGEGAVPSAIFQTFYLPHQRDIEMRHLIGLGRNFANKDYS